MAGWPLIKTKGPRDPSPALFSLEEKKKVEAVRLFEKKVLNFILHFLLYIFSWKNHDLRPNSNSISET
jgi:hypothetical protein